MCQCCTPPCFDLRLSTKRLLQKSNERRIFVVVLVIHILLYALHFYIEQIPNFLIKLVV